MAFTWSWRPALSGAPYVHDLEQRVVSKPGRMLHRAMSDPLAYLLGLPRAVLRQPLKFWREFRAVIGR
ncbi:MAG: hypothetical protein V9E81_10900 [Marmoricola sp.]